jgi:hypothetical protein
MRKFSFEISTVIKVALIVGGIYKESYIFLETFYDLDKVSLVVPVFRVFLVCVFYVRE